MNKLKTFIVCSDTNYNLMVHVVNAETPEDAISLAKQGVSALNGKQLVSAWDGCTAYELNTESHGVVFCDANNHS